MNALKLVQKKRPVPRVVDIFNSPTHVYQGKLLQPTRAGFKWLPARLVGILQTTQEACPCVYADLYALDESGAVICRYIEETRWHLVCTVIIRGPGGWFRLDYQGSHLVAVKPCEEPRPQTEKLTIMDDACLIGNKQKC